MLHQTQEEPKARKAKTLRQWLVGDFSAKRIMRSILFVYACLIVFGLFFTDRLIFQPQPASYTDTREIIKLTATSGKQISAIYLPNSTATHTLLYSHGNGEDLGDILPVLQELQQLGFAVFAYDYQGYGTSQGHPSEFHTYQYINAAYHYLTLQLGIPPQRIIAFGRSVGAGPTLELVTRQPVAGLIVESSFKTAFRVVTRFPIVPFDKFHNLSKIKKIRCPVLVIHGTADQVVPFDHGQALFEAAPEPKRFLSVEQAGHNDVMWVSGEWYQKTLREFAATLPSKNES